MDAATKGLSNVDVLGSLMQDLNQAAAAAVVVSLLALKSIFGRSSGVPGVSHVVVSSVLEGRCNSKDGGFTNSFYQGCESKPLFSSLPCPRHQPLVSFLHSVLDPLVWTRSRFKKAVSPVMV